MEAVSTIWAFTDAPFVKPPAAANAKKAEAATVAARNKIDIQSLSYASERSVASYLKLVGEPHLFVRLRPQWPRLFVAKAAARHPMPALSRHGLIESIQRKGFHDEPFRIRDGQFDHP
jgi:hypothetical protein